ncbi:MAG: twin-arginine translocation signal domain-containing protein, partial [Bacteroidales bacterium]|nr:twin-arginine translocation signal domain-containing protein [Bacteroidales bacterium]
MTDRRSFLKTTAAATAAAAAAPLITGCTTGKDKYGIGLNKGLESRLIVEKANAVPITGTFLDEISTDIPHQNWGEAEW